MAPESFEPIDAAECRIERGGQILERHERNRLRQPVQDRRFVTFGVQLAEVG